MKVAALFVESTGCYTGVDGVDAWDIERDARNYSGPHRVVAHPPCARWCQLASVNEVRYGQTIGDDGGCFRSALEAVRTFGGVLEHPAYSLAWPAFDLPTPLRGGWVRSFLDHGWATEVSQVAYGHPARKRTWLYYVGDTPPPPMNWSEPAWTTNVGQLRAADVERLGRTRITQAESLATPPAFRDTLLELARS